MCLGVGPVRFVIMSLLGGVWTKRRAVITTIHSSEWYKCRKPEKNYLPSLQKTLNEMNEVS